MSFFLEMFVEVILGISLRRENVSLGELRSRGYCFSFYLVSFRVYYVFVVF